MDSLLRHKLILGIVAVTIQFLIVGCDGTNNVRHKLSTAESYMEQRPDTALTILQTVDTEDLSSKSLKAKYALLMSMAKHKNFIDETDYSLINIAVDYYTPKKDLEYAIMSKFYRARVLYNAGRYDDSILSALEAEELSSDSYPLWNARCNELIADIYHKNLLSAEEIKQREKAVSAYRQSGKALNELYARCDLATAYCENGDYEKALEVIKGIESTNNSAQDSSFTVVLLSTSLPILLQNDKNEEVIERFNKLQDYVHLLQLKSQDYRITGIAELNLGNIEKAKTLLADARNSAKSISDEHLNLLLEKAIAQKTGDAYGAMKLLDSLLIYQNTKVKEILSQSVLNSQQRYYVDKNAESKEIIDKHERTIWLIREGIIVLSILIYLVGNAYFVKMKKKLASSIEDVYGITEELTTKDMIISEIKAENNRLLDVDNKLRDSLERLSHEQSNNVKLESMVTRLLSRQFSTINSLCEQYYEEESPINLKMLYKQVANELDKINSDETMQELVDIVNLCRDDIINRIVKELPSLSQKDIDFLTLLYSGFSIKAIAVILKMKPKGVYTKRQRLFKKISLNTSIDPNEALI